MTELFEAFNTSLNFANNKEFQTIDYFFTSRNLTEDQEIYDKHLKLQTKKTKVTYNFLALNIPVIKNISKPGDTSKGFDIEIYGDEGFSYKGTIKSYHGIMPNLMVPLKSDKRIFVNVNYIFSDLPDESSNKRYIVFIDVPKKFQTLIEDDTMSNFSDVPKNELN